MFFCKHLWQFRFSSFQSRDTKLDCFKAKNQHTQRKLLYCQLIFYILKVSWYKNYFHMEGIDLFVKIFFCQDFGFCQDIVSRHKKERKEEFRSLKVQETSSSHLKISNFVSLPWKLDNPYCHNILVPISKVPMLIFFYAFLGLYRLESASYVCIWRMYAVLRNSLNVF